MITKKVGETVYLVIQNGSYIDAANVYVKLSDAEIQIKGNDYLIEVDIKKISQAKVSLMEIK